MNSASGRQSTEKSKARLLAEGLAPYILMTFIGYTVSDVGTLSIRDRMLPDQAPPTLPSKPIFENGNNKGTYQNIISRNFFSPDGTMPEALAAKNTGDGSAKMGDVAPVLSQLPLNLIGTVVLTKAEKSIANIEVKSKNTVIALQVNHEIEGIAKLVKVERNKAFIRNLNNGALEYIEIKNQSKLAFNNNTSSPVLPKGPGEVKQIAPNKFVLKRETLLKHTADLSSLLMQASTTPRRKSNGDIECYVLTRFNPDSIFADLGVSQGDCIKAVNGDPIDSPAKAMELYNALKNAPSIKLTVESDGHDVQKEYNIE